MRNPWPWIGVVTLGLASGNLTAKLALEGGMSALALTVVRFAVALTALLGVLAMTRRLTGERDWLRGGILGVVNLAGPAIFFTIALETLSASLAGLLLALIPAASIAAAHLIVPGERFQAWRIPGLAVAFGGIAILLGGVDQIPGRSLWTAVGWSALGVAAAGCGGALSRRFALDVPPRVLMVPQFVAAAVAVTVVAVAARELGDLAGLGADTWGWAVTTGLAGTAIPFAAFLLVFERAVVARASLVGYLVPAVSAIGAVLFLGDTVSSSLVVGGSVIVAGVVLADRADDIIARTVGIGGGGRARRR